MYYNVFSGGIEYTLVVVLFKMLNKLRSLFHAPLLNFAVAVNNRIAPQTRTADDENCDKINSQ